MEMEAESRRDAGIVSPTEMLAGWRKAADSATPGPWQAVTGVWSADGEQEETFPAVIASLGDPAKPETWLMAAGRGSPDPEANAEFAAVARTAMPLLLAAIEGLTSALQRHRQWFTDSKNVKRCGGCLEPSPCPDDPDMIVARALGGGWRWTVSST
jgi:hypothetical protein